ncbi:MAG: cobaltochelatase subunit CobN, partial [Alphaproteobacteria bacterium]|nr:cobaltochelatase subunit CobN [Alphaproteobacteria bacterium]
MHLLAATPGAVEEGEAVDLGQTPGDIAILSAADTELALLAEAQRKRLTEDEQAPTLRLANIMALGHNLSVDLHVERVLSRARLVVVRLLGGRGYWPYGVERLGALDAPVALLPGDDRPDPELDAFSSLDADPCRRFWRYLAEGGPDNALNCLRYAAHLLGRPARWQEPAPIPRAQTYKAAAGEGPAAPLLFYRAHLQAGNVAAIDMLAEEMAAAGLSPRPVAVSSLKDPDSLRLLHRLFTEEPPSVIVNTTGFAARGADGPGPLDRYDCPVVQAVLSGGAEAVWREGTRGLSPRDIAMNIALPEVDGRLISRAVSFKAASRRDAATECDITRYRPVPDRARFVAELAANWARLRRPGGKRIAVVLANYPTRDGRIGNGVGLDTPASALAVLRALGAEGLPAEGDALMRRLQEARAGGPVFPKSALEAFLKDLPAGATAAVRERWGLTCRDTTIPALLFGDIAVAVQPSRGYDIDPASSYHDPALPPPPAYLAF